MQNLLNLERPEINQTRNGMHFVRDGDIQSPSDCTFPTVPTATSDVNSLRSLPVAGTERYKNIFVYIFFCSLIEEMFLST